MIRKELILKFMTGGTQRKRSKILKERDSLIERVKDLRKQLRLEANKSKKDTLTREIRNLTILIDGLEKELREASNITPSAGAQDAFTPVETSTEKKQDSQSTESGTPKEEAVIPAAGGVVRDGDGRLVVDIVDIPTSDIVVAGAPRIEDANNKPDETTSNENKETSNEEEVEKQESNTSQNEPEGFGTVLHRALNNLVDDDVENPVSGKDLLNGAKQTATNVVTEVRKWFDGIQQERNLKNELIDEIVNMITPYGIDPKHARKFVKKHLKALQDYLAENGESIQSILTEDNFPDYTFETMEDGTIKAFNKKELAKRIAADNQRQLNQLKDELSLELTAIGIEKSDVDSIINSITGDLTDSNVKPYLERLKDTYNFETAEDGTIIASKKLDETPFPTQQTRSTSNSNEPPILPENFDKILRFILGTTTGMGTSSRIVKPFNLTKVVGKDVNKWAPGIPILATAPALTQFGYSVFTTPEDVQVSEKEIQQLALVFESNITNGTQIPNEYWTKLENLRFKDKPINVNTLLQLALPQNKPLLKNVKKRVVTALALSGTGGLGGRASLWDWYRNLYLNHEWFVNDKGENDWTYPGYGSRMGFGKSAQKYSIIDPVETALAYDNRFVSSQETPLPWNGYDQNYVSNLVARSKTIAETNPDIIPEDSTDVARARLDSIDAQNSTVEVIGDEINEEPKTPVTPINPGNQHDDKSDFTDYTQKDDKPKVDEPTSYTLHKNYLDLYPGNSSIMHNTLTDEYYMIYNGKRIPGFIQRNGTSGKFIPIN